jgi:hypothetical protein
MPVLVHAIEWILYHPSHGIDMTVNITMHLNTWWERADHFPHSPSMKTRFCVAVLGSWWLLSLFW